MRFLRLNKVLGAHPELEFLLAINFQNFAYEEGCELCGGRFCSNFSPFPFISTSHFYNTYISYILYLISYISFTKIRFLDAVASLALWHDCHSLTHSLSR